MKEYHYLSDPNDTQQQQPLFKYKEDILQGTMKMARESNQSKHTMRKDDYQI